MPKARRTIGALLVVIAIGAAGCAKPEDKFVGHYQGSIQPTNETQAQMAKLPKPLVGKLNDQIRGLSFDLELRKDKTYTAVATIPTEGREVENGRWALSGNSITLTKDSDGKTSPSNAVQQVLAVGPDPKVLTADMSSLPQAKALGNLVFTKLN